MLGMEGGLFSVNLCLLLDSFLLTCNEVAAEGHAMLDIKGCVC